MIRETDTSGRSRSLDWGHLAVVALVATVTALYLYDSFHASPMTDNLILILPASVLALLLCVGIAIGILRRRSPEEDVPPLGRTPILMGLFALYIVTLPFLGFDVGSAVFVAAALLSDGERRPIQLLAIPICFAAIATWIFAALVPYPLPTLIL
jgi:hypothetical protein